jgi:hypothetical protein
MSFEHLQNLIALSGISLLLSAIALRLLARLNNKTFIHSGIALSLFLISFVPINDQSINMYLRGIFNDLSITTLVLLSYYIFSAKIAETNHLAQQHIIFYGIALLGLFFYPFALGIGTIDPYRWGFFTPDHSQWGSIFIIGLLGLIMVIAYIKRNTLLLLCLALASLAFNMHLLESRNFWDYLFDPLIFLYALFYTLWHLNIKLHYKRV